MSSYKSVYLCHSWLETLQLSCVCLVWRFTIRYCYNKPAFHLLAERLVTLLYRPEDSSCSLPLNIASIFEMLVSHSAFLPTIFSNTSTHLKGLGCLLLESNSCYQRSFLAMFLLHGILLWFCSLITRRDLFYVRIHGKFKWLVHAL